MPTMSETSANSKSEMFEIKRCLQEDGLDPACTEEEKIKHLWKLYLKTQSDLEASLTHVEELRHQQSEEMAEVENYVEHIRSLSDEREALTVELENENEQLKEEVERLQEQLQGNQNEEMREMLLQQDLDDIADGTASEQIAYLLVERARLLDELEAEQSRNVVEMPEGQLSATDLLKILEAERAEFEGELRQQRDSLRGVKTQMENAHEDEVMSMMAENEKLQDLLDQAKKKTNQMEIEVQQLREELDRKVTEYSRLQVQLAEDLESEARSHESRRDVQMLHTRIQELQADNDTLASNLKTVTLELQSQQDSRAGQSDKNSSTVRSLQAEVEKHLAAVMTLESSNQKLNQEKKSLEKRLDFAEKELDDLRTEARQLKAKQKSSCDESLEELKMKVDHLNTENLELKNELSTAQQSLEIMHKQSHSSGESKERLKEHHGELESLQSKVRSLQSQISSLEGDLANSQRETWTLQSDKKNAGESLERTEKQLKETRDHLWDVEKQKDELNLELEQSKRKVNRLEHELEEHLVRLGRLEETTKAEEKNNLELTAKLSAALQQMKEREEQVQWLKQRDAEHLSSEDEKLNQAYKELDSLRQENQEVRSDLAKKDQELRRVNLKLESEKANSESNFGSLKVEVDSVKKSHQTELRTVSQQLEQAYSDCRELRNKLSNKESDAINTESELKRLKDAENRLQNQLQAMEETRADLLRQNKELLEEKDRAWVDIRGLMKQVDSLQSSKEILKAELNMKSTSEKDSRVLLTTQSSEQQNLLKHRAETAERKLHEQQHDLQEALSRLQLAENQLREMAELQQDLVRKEAEITRLRNQLQEVEIQKSLQNASTDDLQHQVAALRQKERDLNQRNNELQHLLLDMEAKLEAMKDHTQSVTHVRSSAEENKKSLLEQLTALKKENDKLQVALLQSSEKYDRQLSRYNDRKIRTKDKLNKAREVLSTERNKCLREVERLTQELKHANLIITRETEWKARMEENTKKMMMEKRELLSQITEQEETVRDHQRAVQVLEVRTRYLEEENTNLQERISSLTRQKQTLDRIIKEYQYERHREPNARMEKLIVEIDEEERALQKMTPETALLLSPRNSTERLHSVHQADRSSQLMEAIMSPRVQSPALNSYIHLSTTLPLAGGLRESMDSDIVDL